MEDLSSGVCSGPGRHGGCGRPVFVKQWGLCQGHYTQRKRGKALAPLRGDYDPNEPCAFPGCDRNRATRLSELCNAHIMQKRSGKPLQPLGKYRPRGTCSQRDDQGRKCCPRCDQWKPISEFYPASFTVDGRASCCIDCDRSNKLQRKYGISLHEYQQMLAKQGGCCAVCKKPADGEGKNFSVDHDHRCCPGPESCGACVRGILCSACNLALGHLRDDPDYAVRLVDYLKGVGR